MRHHQGYRSIGRVPGFVIMVLLCMCGATATRAQPYLDTVVLGDAASEASHAFAGPDTRVITGGLGESARQCLANPSDMYGGDITIDLAVDPNFRNYFTVKLWGEDDTDADIGRLYLYVPIEGTDYQVGYRHEGDYICLSVAAGKPPLPGRFFYSTTLLPLWMTQGKTNLTFKIVSTGRYYALGSGLAPEGNLQFLMTEDSRGIYRAYTHTQAAFNPVGEALGTVPSTTARTSPTESELAPGGRFYNGVAGFLNGRLTTSVSTSTFNTKDAEILALAYSTPHLPTYHDPSVISRVIDIIDTFATAYFADNDEVAGGGNESWGGRFGHLGIAIDELIDIPQFADHLDDIVEYGTGGTQVRRNAWGTILVASRDYGRFSRDRRKISNQCIYANTKIYGANLGLLALGHPGAFSVHEGERYLREAAGIEPFLGSDLPGGGSSRVLGANYNQVTPNGLTREWGYVGDSYGEMGYNLARFYRYTGNPIFRDQAVKMLKARSVFRRPSVEVDGTNRYRTMEVVGLLAWRGVRESDGDYANGIAYGDRAEHAAGLTVAATSLDRHALGYAKQMLDDGQYFSQLADHSRYVSTTDAIYVFKDYDVVKTILARADANGTTLPMLPTSDGQPDFVWADEANGVVAIKHGNERLWIAPYWQAKSGTGINGLGRFLFSTPGYEHYGVLETTPHFTYSGTYFTRPNLVDKPEANLFTPPDGPVQAYQGERLPLAPAPIPATESGPFRGRCNFYAFRYGTYLVGMNATSNETFELRTPPGFVSATNLATGLPETGTILVGPQSTTVLLLDNAADPCPVPMTPLLLTAHSTGAAVDLEWSPASGAATYQVKRSSVSGGPYAVIASNLTGTTYSDPLGTVSDYYVVSSANACGESDDSMESVMSSVPPAPWTSADVGSVAAAGEASYFGGTFTVSGAGSDIGSRADELHFAYHPMTGDGSFVARLAAMQSGGSADKVGLMMRESISANSKLAALLLDTGQDRIRLPIRSSSGGTMNWTGATGPATSGPPIWLRLDRAGDTFTGYTSSDGSAWTLAVSRTVALANTLLVGLAVCSRADPQLNTSRFDHVSLPGWSPPPPAPGNLSAMAGDALVSLSWPAVAAASSYRVKRAIQTGGPFLTTADGITGTSYTDSPLSNGVTYHYVVSGLNPAGEGKTSPEASARPLTFASPTLDLTYTPPEMQLSWPVENLGWILESGMDAPPADEWTAVPGSGYTNSLFLAPSLANTTVVYRLVRP